MACPLHISGDSGEKAKAGGSFLLLQTCSVLVLGVLASQVLVWGFGNWKKQQKYEERALWKSFSKLICIETASIWVMENNSD